MSHEQQSSEQLPPLQQRHLNPGEAVAFEPQPTPLDVRAASDQPIEQPVVGALQMGGNHFMVLDHGEDASDDNRDRYSVVNAHITTDEKNQRFYMINEEVGTLGNAHGELELGREDLTRRGFGHIKDSLSRKHATVEFRDGSLVMHDIGSSFGTEVYFTGPEGEVNQTEASAQPVELAETTAQPEQLVEVAEDIGDVAVEQVIEVSEAVMEQVELTVVEPDQVEQSPEAKKLQLTNEYLGMIESNLQTVNAIRNQQAPQHIVKGKITDLALGIEDRLKNHPDMSPAGVALELAALSMGMAAHTDDDKLFDKIANKVGGREERSVLQNFIGQMHSMEREIADPRELANQLNRRAETVLLGLDNAPEGFNKDGVSLVILMSAVTAIPDVRYQQSLMAQVHRRFGGAQ